MMMMKAQKPWHKVPVKSSTSTKEFLKSIIGSTSLYKYCNVLKYYLDGGFFSENGQSHLYN